jgi:glycosyltransferase involved in cell wall biosynthesis
MNVLMVTNMYPLPRHPSYGVFVHDHVQALERLGIEVDVFFCNPKLGRSQYARSLPRLARMIRSTPYDVLHAHHSFCVAQIEAACVLMKRRPPVVFTIHEGQAHFQGGPATRRGLIGRVAFSKRVKRWALTRADMPVTVDPSLPGAVGYVGRFMVIPPGVDTELFRPMDQVACRQQLGLRFEDAIAFFPADPA